MNTWITEKGTKIQLVYMGPSNVYLVSRDGRAFLVDTSTYSAAREVAAGIKEADGPRPSLLVLTHSHYDHAGGAAILKKKYGLKVAVHRYDLGFLATGESPFPEGITPATRAFMALIRLPAEIATRYPGVKADIAVEDDYSLADFGFDARIIHTPGHSEGCQSVIVDGEIALVGDAMYGLSKKSVVSPLADDKHKVFESICRLRESGCKVFLSGHGPAITRDKLDAQIDLLSRRLKAGARRKEKP